MFCLLLFGIAFLSPQLRILCFIAFTLTTIRLQIRLLDLENSLEEDFHSWVAIIQLNNIAVFINLYLLMTHFRHRLLRSFVTLVLLSTQWLIIYRIISMMSTKEFEFKQYARDSGLGFMFTYILLYR